MTAAQPPAPRTRESAADDAVARMMAGAVAADELDLSIGEPDEPLPAVLREAAVRSLREGRTGYTPKLGLDELRDLVAGDVAAQTGHRPDRADVVVTVGGTGAVAVALAAACVHPDGAAPGAPTGVVLPDPAWPNYRVLAAVEAGLAAGARLVVVSSPSNPTGAVASADALAAVVDLARAHGAWVLSDEAYESVLLGGGRAPSPLSVGGADVTLVARTFSKTYAMTGLRVGALVSPPAFRTAVAALHGTTAGCAPVTAQLTAIEALRALPDRSADLAARFRPRFGRAVAALGPWVAPVGPVDALGGFYLWLDARGTGRTSGEVCAVLRAQGVVASAGTVYSAVDGFVRLSLTAPDDVLDAALARVRTVLDGLAAA